MLPTLATNVNPQTISALTTQIKGLLESAFLSVWVAGEIGSLSVAGSGHVYFNLKDKTALLPAVMWRTVAQRYRYAVKDGLEVVVRGKITVYPPQGKYQLSVEELYQKGVGDQDLALRKLKDKLQKLGYFAPARKKPLPALPRRIALVTSPTGAAIRDMLEIITRRWPCAELWVCGVRVQGNGAAGEIADALQRLNQLAGIDVILLGRGGGSSEDLAAFNEEVVAKAIFASLIPVVSAVGHEIDVTIADRVADVRALTPTDAAIKVSPDGSKVLDDLRQRYRRLRDLVRARLATGNDRLRDLSQRRVFRLPLEPIRERERDLDERGDRLLRAMQQRVQLAWKGLEARADQLESLSPLKVLGRGYSVARTLPERHVIRSVTQAPLGAAVEIVLSDGVLTARVEDRT